MRAWVVSGLGGGGGASGGGLGGGEAGGIGFNALGAVVIFGAADCILYLRSAWGRVVCYNRLGIFGAAGWAVFPGAFGFGGWGVFSDLIFWGCWYGGR